MIKNLKNNLWRFYPNTWGDWICHWYFDVKYRLGDWWFWYSFPWSQWKRCGCCAGFGEEHHSFGGHVDILDCSCCNGLGKIRKSY